MPADWKKRTAAVEMVGWKGGGWEVTKRAGYDGGNVTWWAQHSCGGVHIVKGTTLRFRPPKFCPTCRYRVHPEGEPSTGARLGLEDR